MSRRGLPSLALVLAAGILLAAGVAWLRTSKARPGDPASRLPEQGILVSFRGQELGARAAELSRFPVYRELIGNGMSAKIRRELRWGASVANPWTSLPAGYSALGFYRRGWLAVGSATGSGPRPAAARDEGAWRLLASDASFLPRPDAARKRAGSRLEDREVDIDLNLPAWWGAPGGARREWEPLLPRRALGRVRAEQGRLSERWEIACERRCLLDLLDARGSRGIEARGWSAISGATTAVAWFLLDVRRLSEAGAPESGSGTPPLLARLDQLERFLGIPLRREMAGALSGPGLVALVESGSASEPRPLVALDLSDPDRARRALDRVTALGVLSGAIRERAYRGVSIASWAVRGGSAAIEPAAAVDGGLLLVALRRADVADAIDRLRAAAPEGAGALRRDVAALEHGAWKAASRSDSLTAAWERILGAEAWAGGGGPTRAVLRKEGDRWVLEGSGAAPAFAAEPLLPSLRRISRIWPDSGRR